MRRGTVTIIVVAVFGLGLAFGGTIVGVLTHDEPGPPGTVEPDRTVGICQPMHQPGYVVGSSHTGECPEGLVFTSLVDLEDLG